MSDKGSYPKIGSRIGRGTLGTIPRYLPPDYFSPLSNLQTSGKMATLASKASEFPRQRLSSARGIADSRVYSSSQLHLYKAGAKDLALLETPATSEREKHRSITTKRGSHCIANLTVLDVVGASLSICSVVPEVQCSAATWDSAMPSVRGVLPCYPAGTTGQACRTYYVYLVPRWNGPKMSRRLCRCGCRRETSTCNA